MRNPLLDNLRGLAVWWMVIFHTAYDMHMLGMNHLNFQQGFWYAFPRLIAWTFLFCVGASLNYTHVPKIRWHHLRVRSLKLGSAALAISLVTYFLYPSQWIFFGTLHCILAGSILGALVVNHRMLAVGLLILILFAQYGFGYDIAWVSSVIQRPSLDFIPIYPWFWAILAGILGGPYLARAQRIPVLKFFAWPGRHSLKIYLLHQPIIYGLLFALKSLM